MATVWQRDPSWTQQFGVCTYTGILLGAPAHLNVGSQALANEVARCSSVGTQALPLLTKCVGPDRQEQEHLWQQLFLDPTVWWDNRRANKGSRSPHFRHKGSGEILWLNSMFKPAWVDEQLVSLDVQLGPGPSPSVSSTWDKPEPGSCAESGMGSMCSGVRGPALPLPIQCVGLDEVSSDGRRQEQEKLWQHFFLNPTMWCDNRRGKKSSRSPDFRRKGSGEVLWLNNLFKPAWVDKQLVSLDMQMADGASPSKSSFPRKPEPGRRAGVEMGIVTPLTVSTLCEQGKLSEAVGALESLAQSDSGVSQSLFYTVLKLCTAKKDLVVGRRVHDLTVKLGYDSNAYLGNLILRMYAFLGRLEEAMDVFTRVGKPDAFMWCSIISAHAKHGKAMEAIQLYHEMRGSGVKANGHVFVAALQACAFATDVKSGRKVHCDVLYSGIPTNLFVCNCLVDMYAKCGNLKDARQVFDSMATKDVVTWNAMISGYAKCGEMKDARQVFDSMNTKNVVTWNALISGYAEQGLGHDALALYGQMEQDGLILGNHITFACVLKACGSTGALPKGRQLHSLILERGLLDRVVVGTCLVDMYAKCGELDDARQVFDSLATKDVVTWNALIAGYAEQGLQREALAVYGLMEQEGLIAADHVTFACLLKACASSGALHKGRLLHSLIVERGLLNNVVVGNCLVGMYAKCGEMKDARQVFDSLATKDVVTWNALIAGYAHQGLGQEALVVYGHMEREGLVLADDVTFACLLKACGSTGALQKGRQLHSLIVEKGLLDNIVLGNCLLDMYTKCGELKDARRVFDRMATKDVVTWTALIAGHAQQGLGNEALVLYGQMEQEGLIVANDVTFSCLLNACASTGATEKGRQLHSEIVKRGLLENVVLGNCLVDMYAKCGELEDARHVFDSLAIRDVVTWNSLIAGYAQQGAGQEALILYGQMEQKGLILADYVTFACLLKACGSTGALQKGRQLHSQIVEKGLLDNIVLGNCLVDMYAKCGGLEDARQVFDSMNTKNVVTWNAMISGYGICDDGHSALSCFEEMLVAGIQPDGATFSCLLVACSHEGLVHKGRKHFDSMADQHGIKPTIEHYNCMIDLLGRAGHLDEAEKMLLSFEGQTNVVGLRSLLNACKCHGDLGRAMWCFESIVRLEPQEAPAYVLMANAYADAGRWTDVDRIETQRRAAGAYKKPAVASIEVNKEVHGFLVGQRREDIGCKVESTNARLQQEGGHVPHTKLVLKPVCEKEKEDLLCGHAEKLALAFGLLHTPSGTPLVVTKNLRMCSDCHRSTEIMSRLECRDIVVRDGYRVHRFANGCCSCNGRP